MSDESAEQTPLSFEKPKSLRERYETVRTTVKNAVNKSLAGGKEPKDISAIREGAFHAAEALHEESSTDTLTGLYRRNMFKTLAEKTLAEAIRNPDQRTVEFAMLDLDNFGDKNKKYGESAGDKTLELVGRTIKETMRDTDTAGRWGGEEIVVIMPQEKTNKGDQIGAQRICSAIEQIQIPVAQGQITENITASVGKTEYIPGEPFEDMFERASLGVRLGKLFGKNRTVHVEKRGDGTFAATDLSNGNEYIYESQIAPSQQGIPELTEFLTDKTEMTKNRIVRDEHGKKYIKIEQVFEPAA